jgi:hypothetical protein
MIAFILPDTAPQYSGLTPGCHQSGSRLSITTLIIIEWLTERNQDAIFGEALYLVLQCLICKYWGVPQRA